MELTLRPTLRPKVYGPVRCKAASEVETSRMRLRNAATESLESRNRIRRSPHGLAEDGLAPYPPAKREKGLG